MKKKKNGFIATSLIYSFFLIFLMVLLSIVATYSHNRIILSELKKSISNNLSNYIINGVNNIEEGSSNFSDYLKSKIDHNEIEEFGHGNTNQTGGNALDSYRFVGTNPKNYVLFNNELWRIIGVFSVNNGSGIWEERVKLIRATAIENNYWNTSKLNTWRNGSLNSLLNNTYYNKTGSYINTGLNVDSRNMIDNAVFYTTSVTVWEDYNSADFYYYERDGSDNVTAKVGLIYPSDYGFASNADNCVNVSLKNFNSACIQTNWIRNGNYVSADTFVNPSYTTTLWTITSISENTACVYWIDYNGMVSYSDWVNTASRAVRPVVYLKRNIMKTGGDGSKDNPYTISLS